MRIVAYIIGLCAALAVHEVRAEPVALMCKIESRNGLQGQHMAFQLIFDEVAQSVTVGGKPPMRASISAGLIAYVMRTDDSLEIAVSIDRNSGNATMTAYGSLIFDGRCDKMDREHRAF